MDMFQFNFFPIIVSSLVSIIVGFFWFHPKIFGTIWMKEAGIYEKRKAGINPLSNYLLSLLFCVLINSYLYFTVTIGGIGAGAFETSSLLAFKHGLFHGIILGAFVISPALATNAIFEHKSPKYILVLAGYWTLNSGIMGGILNSCCQF